MNPQKYVINIRPGVGIPPTVNVSQGDIERPLLFTVMDGLTPLAIDSEHSTVTITGTKPSGLGYTLTGDIDGSDVTFYTTEQMTQEPGFIRSELIVTGTGSTFKLGSANFDLVVEPTTHGTGVIDGTTEDARTVLARCEEYASDAAASAAEAASEAGAAATAGATAGTAAAEAVVDDIEAEISDLKSDFDYESILENERNFIVDLKPQNGQYLDYVANADVRRSNNLVYINGKTTSANTRFSLTGGVLQYKTSSPTYASVPSWYVDNLNDFIVGHQYLIKLELLSGSETLNDPTSKQYLTIRTTDQSVNASVNNGDVWNCTVKPNMICLGLKQGTYSYCVYNVEIVDITALHSNAAEMYGNFSYVIPAYFNTQLNNAITKINTDINSNKTVGTYGTDIESFVFITDVHWGNNNKHSPALIKKILESCPIGTVICGGDLIESSNSTKKGAVTEVKDFVNAITGIPCYEYYCVFGNHDNNGNGGSDISVQLTRQEIFNLLYIPFAYRSNVHWIWDDVPNVLGDSVVKADYYVDHPLTKTRYLCIDWQHPYGSYRPGWIASVLSKNDGYRVVVIYHGIYNGSMEEEHVELMTHLEPYKNKIVAVFSGHAHTDAVVDYYEDGSVPVILTSCDKFSETAGAEAGTVKEQCFDVAVIDYGQSKIKLTRIGRGTDRTVNISLT